MTKLTETQREALDELLLSSTWEAMTTFCQLLREQAENRVLTSDVSKTDREIVMLKAKLEGMIDMQKSIFNLREHVGQPRKKK